jgi:hypothetical protein
LDISRAHAWLERLGKDDWILVDDGLFTQRLDGRGMDGNGAQPAREADHHQLETPVESGKKGA